jgi:hypothetical protein
MRNAFSQSSSPLSLATEKFVMLAKAGIQQCNALKKSGFPLEPAPASLKQGRE